MLRRRSTRALSLSLAIVLVVTPVALLARSTAHGKAKCSGMCCRPHARHVADPAASAILPQETKNPSHSEEMSCNRGAAAHLAMCMLPSSTDMDYSVVAPLPPAILSTGVALTGPKLFREILPQVSGFSLQGFLPAPFEPPRS
jgi:hypothetical protein